MTSRQPQPPRQPPVSRSGESPEDDDELHTLIEQTILPGLQLLADELNADPTLTARAERGTARETSVFLEVKRQLQGDRSMTGFFCAIVPLRMPYAIVAHADISPTVSKGSPSGKSHTVPALTFGPSKSHLSSETTPVQVRDTIRAEYDKTTKALGKIGFAPPES